MYFILIYPVYWNIEHYYILNLNPHVNVTVRLVQISAPDSSVCRQSTKLTRDSGRGGYGSIQVWSVPAPKTKRVRVLITEGDDDIMGD